MHFLERPCNGIKWLSDVRFILVAIFLFLKNVDEYRGKILRGLAGTKMLSRWDNP